MNSSNIGKSEYISIFYWLLILTVMIFFMILIGGLTRLTNSGLSMVDWKPLMGTIPPLTELDWMNVFDKYKKSPEFLIVNRNMALNDFKFIFWWEWFHRFFARCIGIVFIIPMIIFIFQKKISLKLFYSLAVVFTFGFFQALVGWWMVKSGLNDNPYVSSYRLAFHLTNAVIILNILFWLTLNYSKSKYVNFFPLSLHESIIFSLIIMLFITIISGAFMAGSDSGKSFNTYPLMNGLFFPDDYFIENFGIKNYFENTIAINFNHRWLATLTFILTISYALFLLFSKKFTNLKLYSSLILLCASLQFILGIVTLVSNVKIIYASLHQINSILFLCSLTLLYHSIKKERKL